MISNHALKKVRLSLSTWQLLLVSTRWQINLSPENRLLKQHNLGQFGCSSLVKKFGRNCLTYLINYQDSTKVWEIPQTLCVVGMTTYYGINFKNSKSVKIFQDMHWVSLAQTASWGSEIWPWYIILWIHKMVMDPADPTEKSVCHSGACSPLCSCCSAIRQLWWVLGGRHGP